MRAAEVFTAVDVLTRLELLRADQAAPQVADRSLLEARIALTIGLGLLFFW